MILMSVVQCNSIIFKLKIVQITGKTNKRLHMMTVMLKKLDKTTIFL